MKTKKFNKKLTLGKKTIAHLKDKEMQEVNGGTIIVTETNPSNNPWVCCLYPPSQILC